MTKSKLSSTVVCDMPVKLKDNKNRINVSIRANFSCLSAKINEYRMRDA